MKLPRLYILICILTATGVSTAQTNFEGSFDFLGHPSSYIHLNRFSENNETGYFVFRQRYTEMIGSPYWYEGELTIATLTLNDGSVIDDVPFKYDVYTDEIIVTQPDQGEFIIDSKFFKDIRVMNNDVLHHFKKSHPDHPHKFFELLLESDVMSLFKDIDIRFNIQEIRVTGLSSEIKRFNRRTLYFIKAQDGGLKAIQLKKKDIMSLIPYHRRQLAKHYMRQHGLKYKSEADVIELFQFLIRES